MPESSREVECRIECLNLVMEFPVSTLDAHSWLLKLAAAVLSMVGAMRGALPIPGSYLPNGVVSFLNKIIMSLH